AGCEPSGPVRRRLRGRGDPAGPVDVRVARPNPQERSPGAVMPRPGTPLVHPRMTSSLQAVGWFEARVAVQKASHTRTDTGIRVPSWSTIPGLDRIPARVAPVSGAQPQAQRHGTEHRSRDGEWVEHTHVVALNGFFPQIDETMRLVVDANPDRAFEIVLAVTDSDDHTTDVFCRVVDETG